ncbi:MAG: hypothetical protein KDH90_12985 [Anaerolineae bacterium]|nr:hypothetical protein [Anaerolineae bacterium]
MRVATVGSGKFDGARSGCPISRLVGVTGAGKRSGSTKSTPVTTWLDPTRTGAPLTASYPQAAAMGVTRPAGTFSSS